MPKGVHRCTRDNYCIVNVGALYDVLSVFWNLGNDGVVLEHVDILADGFGVSVSAKAPTGDHATYNLDEKVQT